MMKQNTPDNDSIIAEVHAVREKILKEYNGDVSALLKDLRDEQAKSGKKVIERLNTPVPTKSNIA